MNHIRTTITRSLCGAALTVLVAVGAAPAAAGGAAAPAAAPAPAAAVCETPWGSADKAAGPLSGAPLIGVRAGRQECFDRLVFEFDGTARGYAARYATEVPTDGEGLDLVPYTAGGAWLAVTLRAPAYDDEHAPTLDARAGDHVVNVLRYDTLRDVVFGGSFEGYTTFAVGVRARLPFRVLTLAGPGTHSRVVLDVAHRW